MAPVVPALILAAGRSERMGRSKALLACGPNGETFVSRLITSLRNGGADDVLVIGRAGDDALAAEVLRCDARFVENPDADRGQLSSLLAGLNAADHPGVNGVIVMPVDIPLVRAETIARLKRAFVSSGAPIARTIFKGRHGHPVIFGRRVFDDLRHADPAVGAKAVMRAQGSAIVDVDVDDESILRDVDTPDDYRRMFSEAETETGK
jgi:CTP:molybdopterin cytidylyltransferase MocA